GSEREDCSLLPDRTHEPHRGGDAGATRLHQRVGSRGRVRGMEGGGAPSGFEVNGDPATLWTLVVLFVVTIGWALNRFAEGPCRTGRHYCPSHSQTCEWSRARTTALRYPHQTQSLITTVDFGSAAALRARLDAGQSAPSHSSSSYDENGLDLDPG